MRNIFDLFVIIPLWSQKSEVRFAKSYDWLTKNADVFVYDAFRLIFVCHLPHHFLHHPASGNRTRYSEFREISLSPDVNNKSGRSLRNFLFRKYTKQSPNTTKTSVRVTNVRLLVSVRFLWTLKWSYTNTDCFRTCNYGNWVNTSIRATAGAYVIGYYSPIGTG